MDEAFENHTYPRYLGTDQFGDQNNAPDTLFPYNFTGHLDQYYILEPEQPES
jgi:hypothetical protein